jgi:hypothetical protein
VTPLSCRSTTSNSHRLPEGDQVTASTTQTRTLTATVAALIALLACLSLTGSAQAAFSFEHVGFGLHESPLLNPNGTPQLSADNTYVQTPFVRQAGSHPDFTVDISVPLDEQTPVEALKDVDVDLPLGLAGNPNAVSTCRVTDLVNGGVGGANCPVDSQVGVAEVRANNPTPQDFRVAVFSIAHGEGVPARFGFNFAGVVALIDARVRPGDYGISSGSFSISQAESVRSVRLTLWGVPADHSHDSLRHFGAQQLQGPFGGPSLRYLNQGAAGLIAVNRAPVPFLSMPTSCSEEPVSFVTRGDSWEEPGTFDTEVVTADEEGTPFAFEGCERLPFGPTVDVAPLSQAAESPTGLDVDLTVPQSQDPETLATAHLRDVKMTFPKGMSINSASAVGLGACSLSEIGLGSNIPPACPDSSRLGTVDIETPLLEETLQGDVFIAKQNDNPFNSLLALYISVKGPGFYLKLPGKIEADPQTGQLTTTFTDNPQLPFETLHLELAGGPNAPLTNPSACGTYAVESELTPWSGTAPVKISSPFTVSQGCGTGGFDPKLNAGTVNPTGGAFSPFILRITRDDGESNLSKIEATLPQGLLAKLGGVPLCGDAQATAGDCPAGSQVGKVVVGAGSGSNPLYVPEAGKAPTAAYLAGPYKGAPYSLVVKVPAQAGPFDLGTVTVRNALRVDTTTAQVTAVSDPLPQILQGIPIAYRDVRVEVNRPDFTINPTSCRQQQVTSTLTAAGGQTATPASLFRATGCGELGFRPQLKISLKGKMNRTGNPALKAVLKAPKGEANIAKTTVTLPKSEFIDNAHINNPCTRVQFNENKCPAGSILGQAIAYTPLLDKPLSGPIYFRSNGGERELPDLVADLNGQIHVTLVGFIDTAKSGGVRTRFQNVPDAPVSKFVLNLAGGKKGLIENSENLCSFTPKAKVQMTGQNGKTANSNLKLGTSCGKGKRKK